MDLGARVRVLRRRQGLRLQDLAEACGCTKSLMSKIEHGHSQPTIATLSLLARRLDVELAHLLGDGQDAGAVVFEQSGTVAFQSTDKGYVYAAFARGRPTRIMQPILFIAHQGQVGPGPLRHPGEEFVHVLSGSMRYRVGAVSYAMGPGDSLYFDGAEEHDIEPLSPEVRYLAVFAGGGGAGGARIRPAPGGSPVTPRDPPSLARKRASASTRAPAPRTRNQGITNRQTRTRRTR